MLRCTLKLAARLRCDLAGGPAPAAVARLWPREECVNHLITAPVHAGVLMLQGGIIIHETKAF